MGESRDARDIRRIAADLEVKRQANPQPPLKKEPAAEAPAKVAPAVVQTPS